MPDHEQVALGVLVALAQNEGVADDSRVAAASAILGHIQSQRQAALEEIEQLLSEHEG